MDRFNRNLDRVTNLRTVKQQLFNNRAVSRADIARNTGLHKSTISSLLKELDAQGYVTHLGQGHSTESGGRRPELYTFNKHYGYVACFNITYAHLYAMFLYIDGQEISVKRFDLPSQEIIDVMAIINKELNKIAEKHNTDHGLLGISFSIHAVVAHNKIVHSPYYLTNGVDLQSYFANRYHVPVRVGNEANLAAIYERDYARRKSPANFAVLSIHRGPGIGVIAKYHLFSGFQGMVGELGSVKVPNPSGEIQEIGDYLSVDFLQKEICTAAGIDPNASYTTLKKVVAQNTPAVNKVIDRFALTTAQVLFNLQMLYGPEEIFINSPLIEFIPRISQQLQTACQKVNVQVPITVIRGSRYVSLLGAGALIIRQVIDMQNGNLNFQWSRKIG